MFVLTCNLIDVLHHNSKLQMVILIYYYERFNRIAVILLSDRGQ